jgi:hypothetical protein
MAAWRNGIASDYDIGDQEIAGSTPAVVIFGACFQRNPTPTVVVGKASCLNSLCRSVMNLYQKHALFYLLAVFILSLLSST